MVDASPLLLSGYASQNALADAAPSLLSEGPGLLDAASGAIPFVGPLLAGASALKNIISGGPTTGTPQESGGAIAPQRTSGFFGIGAKTIPGLVSPPNPAVYANAAPVQAMPAIPQVQAPNLLPQGSTAPQVAPPQAPHFTQQGQNAAPLQGQVTANVDAQGNPIAPQPSQVPLQSPGQGQPQQELPPAAQPIPMPDVSTVMPPINVSAPTQPEAAQQAPQPQPYAPANAPAWSAPFQQFAPAVQGFHDWLDNAPEDLGQALTGAAQGVGQALQEGGQQVQQAGQQALDSVGNALDQHPFEQPAGANPVQMSGQTTPEAESEKRLQEFRQNAQGIENSTISGLEKTNDKMNKAVQKLLTIPQLQGLVIMSTNALANEEFHDAAMMGPAIQRQIQLYEDGAPGDPQHGIPPIPSVQQQIHNGIFSELTKPSIVIPVKTKDAKGNVIEQNPRFISPMQQFQNLQGSLALLNTEEASIRAGVHAPIGEDAIKANTHHREFTPGGLLPMLFSPFINTHQDEGEARKKGISGAQAARRAAAKEDLEMIKGARDSIIKQLDFYNGLIDSAEKKEEFVRTEYIKNLLQSWKAQELSSNFRTQARKDQVNTFTNMLKESLDAEAKKNQLDFNTTMALSTIMATRATSGAAIQNSENSKQNADTNAQRETAAAKQHAIDNAFKDFQLASQNLNTARNTTKRSGDWKAALKDLEEKQHAANRRYDEARGIFDNQTALTGTQQ